MVDRLGAGASLLERDELLLPAALVSHLTEDGEPGQACEE